MDRNIIAPANGIKIKKKRSIWKIILGILVVLILVGSSGYGVYEGTKNFKENKNQENFELNQTLIIQGQQQAFDFIEALRLNCESIVINHTNTNNESVLLSYIPVEGCLSQNQINCILENAPQ